MINVALEAIETSRPNEWWVRPEGQLGTMGSYPFLWTAEIVSARSEQEAIASCQEWFNKSAAQQGYVKK
jgi:hypothetical protein